MTIIFNLDGPQLPVYQILVDNKKVKATEKIKYVWPNFSQ